MDVKKSSMLLVIIVVVVYSAKWRVKSKKSFTVSVFYFIARVFFKPVWPQNSLLLSFPNQEIAYIYV